MRRSLAALVAILALATATASHADAVRKKVIIANPDAGAAKAKVLDPAAIAGDHLKITDLETLEVGDSRTYTTEAGREVVMTAKGSDRYTLAVAGKTLEIGAEKEGQPVAPGGSQRVVIERDTQPGNAGLPAVHEETITLESPALAGAADTSGALPVVIDITSNRGDQQEHRVIVLRLDDQQP